MIGLSPGSAQVGGVRAFTNDVDSTTTGQGAAASYRATPQADVPRHVYARAGHN